MSTKSGSEKESGIDLPPLSVSAQGQSVGSPPTQVPAGDEAPASGRRAFRDIRLQLNDEDLKNPAVGKLIIENCIRAEEEANGYKNYVERYHQANTEVQVLKAKLKAQTAFDILVAVMLTVGGAVCGLAPYLAESGKVAAPVVMLLGVALILGGAVAKVAHR